MASEILNKGYTFPAPTSSPPQAEVMEHVVAMRRRLGGGLRQPHISCPLNVTPQRSVLHNYLHGLEAMWWISVWFLFDLPALDKIHRDALKISFSLIFTGETTLSRGRRDFFRESVVFQKHTDNMRFSMDDAVHEQIALRQLILCLEHARMALLSGYRYVEGLPDFPNLKNHSVFFPPCNAVFGWLWGARVKAAVITEHLSMQKKPVGPSSITIDERDFLSLEREMKICYTKTVKLSMALTVALLTATRIHWYCDRAFNIFSYSYFLRHTGLLKLKHSAFISL